MTYTAQDRRLPDWFTKIRTGQTVLPRFQRHEAWKWQTVQEMLNTILQGLPVGAALVLAVGDKEEFVSRPIRTAPETDERVNEHLLDGQQRLTGLWRALHKNNYPNRTYFLEMWSKDNNGKRRYRVTSISRSGQNQVKRYPLWANRPSDQWHRRRPLIPLDLVSPASENWAKKFREWAKEAIEDRDTRDDIFDDVVEIRESFIAFNLPFLLLPPETKPETAVNVFIKMNSSSVRLSTYDIVVALVEAGMGKSLHDLVVDMNMECPSLQHYYSDGRRQGLERFALNAAALIQRRAPTDSTYMSADFGKRVFDNWDTFKTGLKRATTFLEEERVFDDKRLPTAVVVPALVALWANAPDGLDAEGRAREILRRYLWRAFFTNRYEATTATRSLEDVNALQRLIAGDEAAAPSIFDDGQHPLPSVQGLINARWPVNRVRLGRAVLALALKRGGLDLADGSTVTRENLSKREYHHIFPRAHLERLGVPNDQRNRSLNCALVSWRTNRNISDKEPERYLAERRDNTRLSESQLKERLASHLIPYDEMVNDNYDAFMQARAELIHGEMMKLCNGVAT